MFLDNGAEEDKKRYGLMLSSTIWRTSRLMEEDAEDFDEWKRRSDMWLIHYWMDSQPEGERENMTD